MGETAIYQYLQRHRYGVVSSIAMATSSIDATPQSALVGIAITPELEIVFDTLKTSRKYGNLLNHPSCSFVIGWEGEQTVQIEGIAFQPSGKELRRYQEIYFAAWPDGPSRMSWPDIAYFVVRPRWVRFSDYSRSPPMIAELALPA